MNRPVNNEKVTVKVACRALKLTDRTLYRYVKRGRLTKLKEGNRVYFLANEIRQLKNELDKPSRRQNETIDKVATVIIPSDKYEGLLSELGALKERCNNLLEYRQTNIDQVEALKNNTDELKQSVADLQTELDRVKSRGLMGRIFNK